MERETLIADTVAKNSVSTLGRLLKESLPLVPYVGWLFKIPPISWIANWIIGNLVEKASIRAGNEGAKLQITFEKAQQREELKAATAEIQKVIENPQATPEEVQRARDEYFNRLQKLGSIRTF